MAILSVGPGCGRKMEIRDQIRAWPEAERPREKLDSRGVDSLSNAELLALLLGSGTRGQNAVVFARNLLREFGGLRGLLNAPRKSLLQIPGLGKARVAQLHSLAALVERFMEEKIQRGHPLTCPEDTKRFLMARLGERQQEVFCCIFLDGQHHVIQFLELFEGTLNAANVYPREVVRKSLELGAATVIFAHNHPSGCTEASPADKAITVRLTDALELVDIKVLDHLVIGDRCIESFAENGWI